MKVHFSKVIDTDPKRLSGQVVQFTRAKLIGQDPIVTDGPFTESKESCSHVAIISRCIMQARK